MARAFVDTNVFVYAFDRNEPVKRELARSILREWDGDFVISTQVLQELFVVCTRKLEHPLSEVDAEEVCRRLAALPVVAIDRGLVLRSIALARRDQIALWDALIVTAAQESDCYLVLSEDLQHGRLFDGVTVHNPFLGHDEIHERS